MMKYVVFVLTMLMSLCVKAQDKSEEAIPEGLTSILDSAYYKNTELTSLSIPASVETLGDHIVDHCFQLVNIDVDAENPHFKSIDGVLYSKDGLTLILCPPGKTGEFTIPEHVKHIAPYAFRTCKKLTSVVLPAGIEDIPDGAFIGCWGLEKVNLPQGLKRIGKHAFDGTIVQKMNMPTTMEFIDDEAFVNTSLVEVNLRVTTPFELGEDVFSEIHVTRLNVPAAGLQNFKKHPKWGKFGRITPTHSYWTVKLP
ncbi:MAG: leucine-rich repeat domain-containing protein [Bacteroidaceae bacterium]|nr:leucine-rich repeat domain-containing protein [Bacteroidaceae bacterium]